MIILLILVTFSIEYVLVLWGENWCWSLLGLGSSLFPIPVVIKWCHGGSRGGALGPPPPFIFRPKWGQKGRKKLFADRSPPLSKGLDDHHPPPPLSQGLDPALWWIWKVILSIEFILHVAKTLFAVSFNYFYTLILLVRIIEMMKNLQISRGEQNVLKVICYYYHMYLLVCFSMHCDDITFAFS